MTDAIDEQPQFIEWHRLFAVEQELALTPVGIGVEAEFPTMTETLIPERVMAIGEEWKKVLLQSMTTEELDTYFPAYKQTLLEQGLEQGLELAKRQTVQAMFARGVEIAVIADVTGLTTVQVKTILAENNDITP